MTATVRFVAYELYAVYLVLTFRPSEAEAWIDGVIDLSLLSIEWATRAHGRVNP